MSPPVAASVRAGVAHPDAGGEPSAAGRRDRALAASAVWLPAALATALCCLDLPTRSLGFDEGATTAIVAQHGGALGSAIAHDGGNMAGYYAVLHLLTAVVGNGTFVLRLPSALAAGFTALLTALLARRLFGERAALAAGLLSAVSLPLVFWGQSARGYAPMVALVTASFLALAVLVDDRSETGARRRAWVAYVVFTTLAVYTGYVAALVVPAQLVALACRRGSLRRVASALGLCAVACVPLAVLALSRGSGQLFWVPRPNATVEKQVLEALTSSGLGPSFRATATTGVLLVLTVLLISLIAARILARGPRGVDEPGGWGRALALSWLVVPVALAWVESLFGQPIFVPRNLLVTLPAVALLLASGLGDRRVPGALAWSLVAALLVLRALQLAPSYGVSPEDWHGATSYVQARTQPGDCVAFYPSDGRMPFGYYVGTSRADADRAPRPVLPSAPWTVVRAYVERYAGLSSAQVTRVGAGCPRLWFISSHEGQLDGPAAARANRTRYLLLRSRLEAAYPRREIRSFGYASPARVELLSR